MKKILSHFFTRRGKFTPPYFWVTLFLCLIVAMLVMKLMGSQHISDTLVLGCLGFVAAWLAPANKLRLSIILGIVGTAAAIAGAVAMWDIGHNWYPVALAILALPSTALGGWLFTRASR